MDISGGGGWAPRASTALLGACWAVVQPEVPGASGVRGWECESGGQGFRTRDPGPSISSASASAWRVLQMRAGVPGPRSC